MQAVVQILILGLAYGGVYALFASGLTLIWAVTKEFYVAHGSSLAIAMFGSYSLYKAAGLDPYVSLFIMAPLMFVLGLFVFRFLFRPLMAGGGLVVFVAMLALVWIIDGALEQVFGADQLATPAAVTAHRFAVGTIQIPASYLAALIVSLVVALGFHRLLKGTDFGRRVRAVAQNAEVARLMGINVAGVQLLVFGLAFVLLALAASLVSPLWTVSSRMGLHLLLFAFIVLTLGGMGNFVGALFAGIIIGVVQLLSMYYLGATLAPSVPYVCFILILLVKPTGLFAK